MEITKLHVPSNTTQSVYVQSTSAPTVAVSADLIVFVNQDPDTHKHRVDVVPLTTRSGMSMQWDTNMAVSASYLDITDVVQVDFCNDGRSSDMLAITTQSHVYVLRSNSTRRGVPVYGQYQRYAFKSLVDVACLAGALSILTSKPDSPGTMIMTTHDISRQGSGWKQFDGQTFATASSTSSAMVTASAPNSKQSTSTVFSSSSTLSSASSYHDKTTTLSSSSSSRGKHPDSPTTRISSSNSTTTPRPPPDAADKSITDFELKVVVVVVAIVAFGLAVYILQKHCARKALFYPDSLLGKEEPADETMDMELDKRATYTQDPFSATPAQPDHLASSRMNAWAGNTPPATLPPWQIALLAWRRSPHSLDPLLSLSDHVLVGVIHAMRHDELLQVGVGAMQDDDARALALFCHIVMTRDIKSQYDKGVIRNLIFEACKQDAPRHLQILLDANAVTEVELCVEHPRLGGTCLTMACRVNAVKCVEILLESFENELFRPERQRYYLTYMHFCAIEDHPEVLKVLLDYIKHGQRNSLRCALCLALHLDADTAGQTPLNLAHEGSECQRMLAEAVADPNTKKLHNARLATKRKSSDQQAAQTPRSSPMSVSAASSH
eukprot:TRINITY_DN10431_c0_g1_i2.p1 TRINITY_DN10431_c0_g1~~TRINITY_DN10431_c0_g1_i2.p1  ORF type:complete len:673 (+),score=112.18 TRINITY_DN10431_c0_g1_i2:197-2020(+)